MNVSTIVIMNEWQMFYSQVKGQDWPECPDEKDFDKLPNWIQEEFTNTFNYIPGQYLKKSKLENKIFPIVSATACKLKWSWSSIYLTLGTTASCHRTNHHKFDIETFNFHNTKSKIQDRRKMLKGEWPSSGCEYCKDIEIAGGQSDRLTNLKLNGINHPPELDIDPNAVNVTPRILEVYFDNVCNLKCLYCGPHFSSLWDAENVKFGDPSFIKDINLHSNKLKVFDYLKKNNQHLTVFNFLGGEPFFQTEFLECLEIFENYPAPNLKLQVFSNLNIKKDRLEFLITKIETLIEKGCLLEFELTASLDCWGAPQEYVRFPLSLQLWEENFLYVLSKKWINLIIGSTITPLTVKTFPELIQKINDWSKVRKVYHYQNSVNFPTNQLINIFGNIFEEDFKRALELKPENTNEEIASKEYLEGIYKSSKTEPVIDEIKNLHNFLNLIDFRRGTNWRTTFPWLKTEFLKYNLD
jgi:hypothetical protein